MTGNELMRRLYRLGRMRGIEVRLRSGVEKAATALFYGHLKTTLKDRKKEIGPGLLHAILTQLRLSRRDIEE